MIRIYGIKNCDTMKKADRLVAWCQAAGWKTLLNTKGPTFRKLPPERREIATQSAAVALMVEFSSVIKRPVVETETGQLLIGFDPALFSSFAK
ncbi:MAG: arsenate reductase [Rhodocyclales bacterium]|nr:arsenate reductase [Rhodocyclales bacterium]